MEIREINVFLLELSVRGPKGLVDITAASGDLDNSTWYCFSSDRASFLSHPAFLPNVWIHQIIWVIFDDDQ